MATSCFNAYLSSIQSNVTGDNTSYQIVFDTLLFDDNSDYNTSTGVFTAPVTGKYLFSTTVLGQNLVESNQPSVFIVTSARTYYYANNGHAFEGNNLFSYTVIADMTENDTAHVIFNVYNGTKTVNVYGDETNNPRTFFSGYQVA
jgi:hypothetical protein